MTRRARVIVASDRASAGDYADRSGQLLADGLRAIDFEVDAVTVVPDGDPVGAAIADAVAAGFAVVVTTGGTGIGPRDLTPEATRPLLDRELPHLAGAIVAHGLANGVPTASLSRGLCGLAGATIVVNLPGSTGGVRDGLAVLAEVLPHAVAQVRGADHDHE